MAENIKRIGFRILFIVMMTMMIKIEFCCCNVPTTTTSRNLLLTQQQQQQQHRHHSNNDEYRYDNTHNDLSSSSFLSSSSKSSLSISLSRLLSIKRTTIRIENKLSSLSSLQRLLDIRGGAKSKRNKKSSSRTASIHSSNEQKQQQKTATGKRKVGASSSDATKESATLSLMLKYKQILPLTRIHLTLIGVITVIGLLLGEEMSQGLLALDPIRTIYGLEIWRFITAGCYLGPPSIGWLFNAYYLFQYGTSLERAYGTSQYFIFMMTQIIILSIMSILLGQPFFASSIITAMLHVLSRSMPYQNVKWLIFTVPYWSLPYGLMITDVLQAQNGMAALPHILGIISGHFYYFHKFIWTKLNPDDSNNNDWLVPSNIVCRMLDKDENENDIGKQSIQQALKNRKKQKKTGRKLGTA